MKNTSLFLKVKMKRGTYLLTNENLVAEHITVKTSLSLTLAGKETIIMFI
jgi:hypothetical protein